MRRVLKVMRRFLNFHVSAFRTAVLNFAKDDKSVSCKTPGLSEFWKSVVN